jgi:integrase
MPSQLPSGNWRPRIRHPRTGKHLNPQAVIGGPSSYPDRPAAERAETEAVKLLRLNARAGVTVREWWTEWTTDPLWARPAESTNLHNAERTRRFVDAHGHLPIRAVDDDVVREYRRSGSNDGTVPALRAMFNDAARADAGRLVDRNPFANLRVRQSRGRRDVQPPAQADAARMVALADRLTPPSFAAYLDTAIHEGARPGELDALLLDDLDFTPSAETVRIERQWNVKTRKFTLPKHGVVRTVAMTPATRERLLTLPRSGRTVRIGELQAAGLADPGLEDRESEWVFLTLRNTHYTPSSRSHHWNRVRCAAGLGQVDLYTATRHHFAWYAWNVLGLDPADIAQHFGHQDGGELVRRLYGHFDQARARDRVRVAFADAPAAPTPIRTATEEAA